VRQRIEFKLAVLEYKAMNESTKYMRLRSPLPSGVASYGAMEHVPPTPRLDFQQFYFSSLWSKSENQLFKYCVVYEIS